MQMLNWMLYDVHQLNTIEILTILKFTYLSYYKSQSVEYDVNLASYFNKNFENIHFYIDLQKYYRYRIQKENLQLLGNSNSFVHHCLLTQLLTNEIRVLINNLPGVSHILRKYIFNGSLKSTLFIIFAFL